MNKPQLEYKVWGSVLHIFASPHAAVSCLTVEAGYCCSKHYHRQRVNQFAVQEGLICVETWKELNGERTTKMILPGEVYIVPSGMWHRFRVLESGKVVEVYWPDRGGIVKLDDIVRADVGGKDDLEDWKMN